MAICSHFILVLGGCWNILFHLLQEESGAALRRKCRELTAVWWRSYPMAVWFSEWIPGEDGAWLSQGSLQETWRTIEKACLKMWGKP